MERRQGIAIGIALQTQIIKACPVHQQLYCDDDVDPAGAFALAEELVRRHRPYVEDFHNDAVALTDLLSYTLCTTPAECPDCCRAAH